MKRLKTAVFGAGFMGKVHSEAIRRLGFVDIVGVAAVSDEEARSFGNAIGVERTTSNYKELLADPTIDAVHVCTPNNAARADVEGCAAGGQGRSLREAADAECCGGRGTGEDREGEEPPELRQPQPPLLPVRAADPAT